MIAEDASVVIPKPQSSALGECGLGCGIVGIWSVRASAGRGHRPPLVIDLVAVVFYCGG